MAKGVRNWCGRTCIRGRLALAAAVTKSNSNRYFLHDPIRSLPSSTHGIFFRSHGPQVSAGSMVFVSRSIRPHERFFARQPRRTEEAVRG